MDIYTSQAVVRCVLIATCTKTQPWDKHHKCGKVKWFNLSTHTEH